MERMSTLDRVDAIKKSDLDFVIAFQNVSITGKSERSGAEISLLSKR